MKSLVIAEKPSVARDIARVLGANQKNVRPKEGTDRKSQEEMRCTRRSVLRQSR